MSGARIPNALAAMERRLLYLARRTYRIPRDRAADLVRSTRAAFLQLQRRDPSADSARILVTIFRDACRRHVERGGDAARSPHLLQALAALRPPGREVFRLITEENLSRREVAERLRGVAAVRGSGRERQGT